MLRKRTRSHQKDQMLSGSDSYSQSDFRGHNKHKSNSFFSIQGLFVGPSNKGLSDYDSVWSPTSPLDIRVFSSIGNPFARSPRSSQNGNQKGWGSGKVGLSIVDSLDDNTKLPGKIMRPSESKNILFGPGMRIKNPKYHNQVEPFPVSPKSLHKEHLVFPQTAVKATLQKGNPSVVFEIGDFPSETRHFGEIRACSLDSCRPFSVRSGQADPKTSLSVGNIYLKNIVSPVSSPHRLVGEDPNMNGFTLQPSSGSLGSDDGFKESLSASEIELSEDYTCVISHGPNPKTTHIYGDRVLESHTNAFTGFNNNEEKQIVIPPAVTKTPTVYPSYNFLSFCHSCNKKLEGQNDIYIYRGEKAFCSLDCRSREIMMDEEMEEATSKSSDNSPKPDEFSVDGVIFTT